MITDPTPTTANQSTAQKIGGYRWYICGLLFFCTTVNYIDRNSLSVLKTTLQANLHWTDVDYGWVTFAFTTAYAAFPSLIGTLIDKFGVKVSLAGALILWSLMAAAHGLVGAVATYGVIWTVIGFAAVRFFLGFAEAANFPASIKAVAMWFPQKERALATGIFNSGTNVGVMLSFATVLLAETHGWTSAFYVIGLVGFVWLLFWQTGFDVPENVTAERRSFSSKLVTGFVVLSTGPLAFGVKYGLASLTQSGQLSISNTMGWVIGAATAVAWLAFGLWFARRINTGENEVAYIQADQPKGQEKLKVHWTALLRYREIWPFLIGKLITDPVWWFYLYWLPSYLEKERGQNPLKSAGLLALIYTGASVGSIAGGWLSGFLMGRGWKTGSARLGAMFIPAVLMPGAIWAYYTDSFAVCIACVTLATACHQAWSANIFTTATDLFPAKVSGSVVGLGAMTGGIGGMFMTLLAAMIIQWTGKQQIIFICAGVMHPISWLIFRLWLGNNFKTANVDQLPDLSRTSKPLLTVGTVIGVLGAVLIAAIVMNWDVCVAAVKVPGAAQAVTAAVGVFLIGGALFYAGMSRKVSAVRG